MEAPRGRPIGGAVKCRFDPVDLRLSRVTGSTRREAGRNAGESSRKPGASGEQARVRAGEWCKPRRIGRKRIWERRHALAAARRVLLNPVNLIPFPVLGMLALAWHYHLIADEPLWLILGAMVLTQLVTTSIVVVFPPGTPDARPRLLLTAEIVLTGLCVYTNGWGSLLAVGFVFAAATAIHNGGSRYAVWAMGLTAADRRRG